MRIEIPQTQVGAWGVFMIAMGLFLLVLLLTGCEGSDSNVRQMNGWTNMGSVSDGSYSTTLWKRQDHDTGDWIYVTTGKGGVFVVKGAQK